MLYVAAALLLATAGLYVLANSRKGAVHGTAAGSSEAPIGGRSGVLPRLRQPVHRPHRRAAGHPTTASTPSGEYILQPPGRGPRRRGRAGRPRLRQERVHRRLLRQLLLLGERRRRPPPGLRRLAPRQAVRRGGRALRAAPHRLRRLRVRGPRRDHRRRALGEDGRELDRLLDHEHRQGAAVAARPPRGEVQGQAGRGQLLRAPRRPRRRRPSCSPGRAWLALEARGFAVVNLALVVLWLLVAVLLVRENHRLSSSVAGEPPA